MIIPARQNDPSLLRLVHAWTWRYRVAQAWRRVRLVGTVGLAAAAPVVVFAFSEWGTALGAIAGAWTVLGRTLLLAAERGSRRRAAKIQEEFDTQLFKLKWNRALAGEPPSAEEIASDASHAVGSNVRDWYPEATGRVIWPLDVVICQRASVVWGRRSHSGYAILLLVAVAAWFCIGIIIAVAAELTVDQYLVRLALPSLPAILDGVELYVAHRDIAEDKRCLETEISILLDQAREAAIPPTPEDCRRVQDRIFVTRRTGPQVPLLYHTLRRTGDEASMQAAADSVVERLPASVIRG